MTVNEPYGFFKNSLDIIRIIMIILKREFNRLTEYTEARRDWGRAIFSPSPCGPFFVFLGRREYGKLCVD